MSDLKQFWSNVKFSVGTTSEKDKVIEEIKYRLGLFFWERGGKQFVLNCMEGAEDWDLSTYIQEAEYTMNEETTDCFLARCFLWSLACLGEERVKELIKQVKNK